LIADSASFSNMQKITMETISTQSNTEFFVSLCDTVPPWFKKTN